jgi:hypothetical protein
MAKNNAIPYFLFVDQLARRVVERLFPPEAQNEPDGA